MGQRGGKDFPGFTLPLHQGCPTQRRVLQQEKCPKQPLCFQWSLSAIFTFWAGLLVIPSCLLEIQDVLLN